VLGSEFNREGPRYVRYLGSKFADGLIQKLVALRET